MALRTHLLAVLIGSFYAVRPYVVNSLILVVVDAFVPTMAEMPRYIVALSSVVSKVNGAAVGKEVEVVVVKFLAPPYG